MRHTSQCGMKPFTLTHFFPRVYCTYCVLSDDVGGVSFCVFFRFLGRAEHMKQLLYSILQQPVNQSLQQRQLRNRFYWEGETGIQILTTSKCIQCIAQSSPLCHRLQTSLQCPKEEEKHTGQKCKLRPCIPEEELLHPVFTFISTDFPGAPASPYEDIKANENKVISIYICFWGIPNTNYRVSFQASFSFISLQTKDKWATEPTFQFLLNSVSVWTQLPSYLCSRWTLNTQKQRSKTLKHASTMHDIKLAIL